MIMAEITGSLINCGVVFFCHSESLLEAQAPRGISAKFTDQIPRGACASRSDSGRQSVGLTLNPTLGEESQK